MIEQIILILLAVIIKTLIESIIFIVIASTQDPSDVVIPISILPVQWKTSVYVTKVPRQMLQSDFLIALQLIIFFHLDKLTAYALLTNCSLNSSLYLFPIANTTIITLKRYFVAGVSAAPITALEISSTRHETLRSCVDLLVLSIGFLFKILELQ